jgi:hypothetical protein
LRGSGGKPTAGEAKRFFTYEQCLEELGKIRQVRNLAAINYSKLDEMFDSLDPEQIITLTDEVVGMNDVWLLDRITGHVMSRLVGGGLPAARLNEWLDGTKPALERSRLVGMAGAHFYETGRGGFWEFVSSFDKEEDRGELMAGYYCRLAHHQPETAVREFLARKPASTPYSELAGVIGNMPETANFPGLAKMLLPDSEPGAAEVRSTLFREWAEVDPAKASEYAWTSAESSPEQMGTVMEAWCRSNPRQAAEWLYSQGASPKAQEAVKAFIRTRASSDPTESWGLVALIPDAEAKQSAYREIYEKWKRYRPEEAEAAWRTVSQEN